MVCPPLYKPSFRPDVLFKRIAHSVHQVVEVINRDVQLVAELVPVPCVVADFRQEVDAAGMDDDF